MSLRFKKILFSLVFFCFSILNFINLSLAQDDNFGSGKVFETTHFTVIYSPQLEISDLQQKLNFGNKDLLLSISPPNKQPNLGTILDALFNRVCNILDMNLFSYHGTIKICDRQTKLNTIYQHIFDKDLGGMRSFYIYSLNTIYLSADNFSCEIVGHEIAHAVISHYFVVTPSTKIQEVLAGYAEYQLRKARN